MEVDRRKSMNWISVKDQLPQSFVPVLTWHNGYLLVEYICHSDSVPPAHEWFICANPYQGTITGEPSHWMPMPHPPMKETTYANREWLKIMPISERCTEACFYCKKKATRVFYVQDRWFFYICCNTCDAFTENIIIGNNPLEREKYNNELD